MPVARPRGQCNPFIGQRENLSGRISLPYFTADPHPHSAQFSRLLVGEPSSPYSLHRRRVHERHIVEPPMVLMRTRVDYAHWQDFGVDRHYLCHLRKNGNAALQTIQGTRMRLNR